MSPHLTVTLPDGSPRELEEGTTVADLAQSIGPRLAKAAVAGSVNGKMVDLGAPLHDGDAVAIITPNSD